MRILILSSSTGAGHDSCAKAVKENFDKHGEECQIVEVLNFISKALTAVITNGHTLVYRYLPWAFKIGYKYMDKHSSSYARGSLVNKILASGGKKLYSFIEENGYDVVICSHPFATITLAAALEGKKHNIKTGFVATDYTCAPTIDTNGIDAYFIPNEKLKDEFIRYGIKEEKIVSSGIPVRSKFYDSMEKIKAKNEVGINPEHSHLVIMCGSMGCGPIEKIVSILSKNITEQEEITVVCGTNKGLEKSLCRKHKEQKNIHIAGFEKNMSRLLDSADLYLTKPGGLSVSEAETKKLPMVFINAVAGCEEYNLNFFVNLGAAVCEQGVNQLSDKCIEILKSKEIIEKMRAPLLAKKQNAPVDVIRNYFVNNTVTK